MSTDTYKLVNEGTAIECLVCNMTSHSIEDVRRRWCGICHSYHNTPHMQAMMSEQQSRDAKEGR